MDIKKRERILILISLIGIVFLAGDRIVLTPLGRTWKRRSERIAELKRNVEKGETLLERKKDIESRWIKMKESGFSQDSADAENRLLTRVNNWTLKSGLSLNSLKPRWVETGGDEKKLEIRLTGSGTLDKACRFLYELERDPLPLSVGDFGISSRDRQSQTLEFSARFSSLILQEVRQ